jgi:SAM-dependent methyltransferase
VPAVLRLVQSVMLGRWRATGEELYREVADLTRAKVGTEVLVSGCTDGVTAAWLATRTGAAVTGVDPDAASIARADARARAVAGVEVAPSYEVAPLDDLPHESAMFDAAIGEPSLAAARSPAKAVAEVVRVTKPMGRVVLLLPTWTSDIPEADREPLVERLGLRPHLLVEWKQMLRDAGVVEVVVQDWSDGGPGARASGNNPEVPQLTWRQKAHIAGRTFRRRGWRAARVSVRREAELLRELSRDRALGFHLISGVKWPHARDT